MHTDNEPKTPKQLKKDAFLKKKFIDKFPFSGKNKIPWDQLEGYNKNTPSVTVTPQLIDMNNLSDEQKEVIARLKLP